MHGPVLIVSQTDESASKILAQSISLAGIRTKAILTTLDKLLDVLAATTPSVIVSLGQETFNTLTDTYNQQLHNVHSYLFQHNGIPLIPSFAPNQIFEQPDRHHWLTFALKKAANYKTVSAQPTLHVAPTLSEILAFLVRCKAADCVSIDIECVKETCELTAIAFALANGESMSIPFASQFMAHYFLDPTEELQVWQAIEEVLSTPNLKIFQNYMFDAMILYHFGLQVKGPIEDTLWIANLLYPEFPKGLKDLGRQYLYCEPWKTQTDFTLSGDPIPFWRYNALDASRTFEIYNAQNAEINNRNLRNFYDGYVKPLHRAALDSCELGLKLDTQLYDSYRKVINELCQPIAQRLKDIANPLIAPIAKRNRKRNKSKDTRGPSPKTGKDIVLTKGYDETIEPFNPSSPAQVKIALKTLGYRIPTKDGKETTDEIALLKLQRKASHEFIETLIKHRELEKIRTSYLNITFDNDARCHFTYNRARDNDNNLGTRSGRFGCSTTPWGTGLNIQTIPRKSATIPIVIKNIFISDTGMELLQVDLSQAELRVVAWLSGDQRLIAQLDAGDDIHTFMAAEIERTLHIQADRQFGKFVNHSTAYGLGKNKFCDKALKDLGVSLAPDLAQKIIDLRFQTYPALKSWQQRTFDTVQRTRRLTSPHGRERYFYGQFDTNMEREALSFIPQATVVDTINRAWLDLTELPTYDSVFQVLTQVHDSLLIQVNHAYRDKLIAEIDSIFARQSFIIGGRTCIIPHDIEIAKSPTSGWGDLKKL